MYIYMDTKAEGVDRTQCEALTKARKREKDAVIRGLHALKVQKMWHNDKFKTLDIKYKELQQRMTKLRKAASRLN